MIELDIKQHNVYNAECHQTTTKYVLAIPHKEAWDMETVSGLIAGRTTLSKAEVEFVLRELEDVMVEALELGAGVELGALGKVKPSLSSAAVDTKDDISLENIRKVNLIYKPSKRIKRTLKGLKFEINRRKPLSDSDNKGSEGKK